MRKAALFLVILSLAACGGRTANPTSAYKFGDEDLSCEELEYEFSKVERDIRARYGEWKGNSDSNVALGVAGAVLLWPVLFAIDNGDAEEVEINALRDRAETLTRIARKKDCSQQGIRERLDAIDNMRKETAAKPKQKEQPAYPSKRKADAQ